MSESAAQGQHEDCDERIARLRAAATDVRLRDAQTVGDLLDDARQALEAAYAEFGRAEEHHRWHHEQEGREVELDEERMRVLTVIAEALDSLGANDD
jgi:acyl-CoA reductase-like NAD-dependent aldehyde dehydrogenase